jgi:queuine tRNA-ribosyltransferase
LAFDIIRTDDKSSARAGTLQTSHGEIKTPIFMPVGTQATVKGVEQGMLLDQVDPPIILSNTYHLFLRPGHELISEAGGLHKFMGWKRAILTDSGGYQVYSLSQMRKITEEGVSFQSHIDGAKHLLTPEFATEVQYHLGADIIMAFDECPPYPCEKNYAEDSMHLTHRWLDRCIEFHRKTQHLHGYDQILAPIVQGSTYPELRKRSAEFIASRNMPLNAIGGLSVGEPAEDMYEMTGLVCSILPVDKPRYLMGVGTPSNVLECIALGVDMFDCVLPSRNARHGILYTREGVINIRNEKWKRDFSPIDPGGSQLSRIYSKAYLRHLLMSKELLAATISTVHNLAFYLDLVREARERIIDGSFSRWKEEAVKKLSVRL